MGTVAIPRQPVTPETWIECFDLIAASSDTVMHLEAVDWSGASSLEFLSFLSAMASDRGLSLFLTIDPLTPDRIAIDPAAPAATFADPATRAAVTAFAARVARECRPAWLAIGAEINTYLGLHPEELADFASLFDEAAAAAKAESPSTRILATFQYERLSGATGDPEQWQILPAFGPAMEAVGVTTYPAAWFDSPEALPGDYYDRFRQHDSRPVVIAESGWPAQAGATWAGDPGSQARFVDLLARTAARLPCELWIWWFLHDWEAAGYAEYFRSMGLRTSTGTPRPAWERWTAAHSP